MTMWRTFVGVIAVLLSSVAPLTAADFDVRAFGAKGDGQTLDSDAINRAIEAAAAAGGGSVVLPAGRYLSFSVRLKSNIAFVFAPGAVLVAAEVPPDGQPGGYDEAEPNPWGDVHRYQDFGHSHWHNSLIWGENLENVSIVGPGLIEGKALSRGQARPRGGNKAIALKLCRNVLLRDFSVLSGGHFALLATGVDNLTIDNLKVDTNRDALDIDACRQVRISNCTLNTPNDDALVLKSSYALGFARACENITITNCQVSGYDFGTLLDGTFQRTTQRAPDRDGPTGRIKFGTESNGGFKNITITNCVFDRSRGLALETVDGGVIEDVTITNITMRDITNAPFFIRLGNRARGPAGTPVGAIRRVSISHVSIYDADARYASIIAGIPGHPVENIRLSDIRIVYKGGLTLAQIAQQPAELVNTFFMRGDEPGLTGPRDPLAVPERITSYPEPSAFGLLPAYGFYLRHVKNITLRDVAVSVLAADERAPFVLEDVDGAELKSVTAQRSSGSPFAVLRNVRNFAAEDCAGIADVRRESAEHEAISR